MDQIKKNHQSRLNSMEEDVRMTLNNMAAKHKEVLESLQQQRVRFDRLSDLVLKYEQ